MAITFKTKSSSFTLDEIMFDKVKLCEEEIKALSDSITVVDYNDTLLRLIAKLLVGEDYKEKQAELESQVSLVHLKIFDGQIAELFRISGLSSGEAMAAGESPGTGTSIPSSPNSPQEIFAPETGTGSDGVIP